LQGSGNLDFLERSFLGTTKTKVRSTVKTPRIEIPQILTFLAEELMIQPTKDISPQGSVHSALTPEQIHEVPVTSPASSAVPVVMSMKDLIIDELTIRVTTVQKTVTTQPVSYQKSDRATLN
jgi:hypothetical protein